MDRAVEALISVTIAERDIVHENKMARAGASAPAPTPSVWGRGRAAGWYSAAPAVVPPLPDQHWILTVLSCGMLRG